jgi:polysaccharide pyruvyl transferase WcaK-like protein
LRRRVPAAEIVCFTVNPANTTWRHGVPAHPVSRHVPAHGARRRATQDADAVAMAAPARSSGIKAALMRVPGVRATAQLLRSLVELPEALVAEWRFIQDSRARLRDMDLVLIAGSNQFVDSFGGPWAFPYAMLKWAWLGRLAGSKVAFVSVGAGPVTSPISFFFLRLAMLAADHISFRDEASRELATCGWAGHGARVSPDLAFSLMPYSIATRSSGEKPLQVGLNPMPVYDRRYWYEADDEAYLLYVRHLATFCAHLDSAGYSWFFYSMQPKDADVMADVVDVLRQQGRTPDQVGQRFFQPETVDELVNRLAQADILVATRFHGLVLPLMLGRPALGVCYHRKMSDVLQGTGLSGFHVRFDELDAARLTQMLQAMETRRDELQETVRSRVMQYRHELDVQYERLLDLVPHARHRGAAERAVRIVETSPASA